MRLEFPMERRQRAPRHHSHAAARRKARFSKSDRVAVPRIPGHELLSQLLAIPITGTICGNTELQALKRYFSVHSIDDYMNKGEILDVIFRLIDDPDPAKSRLGLSSFIAILCQNRSRFPADFAGLVLQKIHRFLAASNTEHFLMCLHIAVHISGTSIVHCRAVQELFPVPVLFDVVLDPSFMLSIKHKAIYLLGNYTRSLDVVNETLADLLSRAIAHVLAEYEGLREIVREAIWLCYIFVTHHRGWELPMTTYDLLGRLNHMLLNSASQHTVCWLLTLIGEISASSTALEKFDLGFVVQLLASEYSSVQTAASSCVRKCIEFHQDCLLKLMELGLVEHLACGIKHGSFSGIMKSVRLITELASVADFPVLEIVIKLELLDYLVDLIPLLTERPLLKMLELIWKCARQAQRDGMAAEFAEQFGEAGGREVLADCELDNRVSVAKTAAEIVAELESE
jgi:hypothetical protein